MGFDARVEISESHRREISRGRRLRRVAALSLLRSRMSALDFSRWALIAPNNDSGLGRMAQDMMAILPLGRHYVCHSNTLPNRPLSGPRESLFSARSAPMPTLKPGWRVCRASFFSKRTPGIRASCRPRGGWASAASACPCGSGFAGALRRGKTATTLRARTHSVFGSCAPTDLRTQTTFPGRWICTVCPLGWCAARPATSCIMAASWTRMTAKALAIRSPLSPEFPIRTLRLDVRLQKPETIASHDSRIAIQAGNLPDPAALYREGDAFIQPSKLEGIGFSVLEAVACGLPVITLDAPPMNEWARAAATTRESAPFSLPGILLRMDRTLPSSPPAHFESGPQNRLGGGQ